MGRSRTGEVLAKLVWIASYPKSGNTWLRFLVGNLVYGPVESSRHVDALVPDLHQGVTAEQFSEGQTTCLKTHLMYREDLPFRECTIGVIYIYRHPLQVIASNLQYHLLNSSDLYFKSSDTEQKQFRKDYIDRFIEHAGDPRWISQGMGSWAENVVSWIEGKQPYPCLHTSYEILKKDPLRFVHALSSFLHLERSEKAILDAIDHSSFDTMRKMEDRESSAGTRSGFSAAGQESAREHGMRFMHQGKIDSYRSVLTHDQIARAKERFGPLMEQLGYEV